ncbi:MAG: metal-dependent hydrolase [Bryobacterales bacterium]|nr:metal-dependent hydrolase [Bryobacterales bacterium]
MDNLTHSLVGLLLRRVGVGRAAARPTLLCVIAANAPDADIVMGLSAPEYLHWHRNITHAVVMIPVVALASAALVWAIDRALGPRKPWSWRAAWLGALLPAASHPLLDAMNSYAVRPWLPFSGRWFSFDTLFVLDWVVWLILLAAALWPALANLVAREIGAPAERGRRAAWAGLLALTLYVGFKGYSHAQVVHALEARLWEGRPATRAAAFPAMFNPLGWTGYVETDALKLTLPLRVDRLADIERTPLRKFYPPADAAMVDVAWNTEIGRAYREFSLFPIAFVEPQSEGVRVTLTDARFVREGRAGFAVVVELDEAGGVTKQSFEF